MAGQHTPEPWEFDGVEFIFKGPMGEGKMIAEMRGWGWLQKKGEEAGTAEQEANGRRIVACVNACANITTESLEESGPSSIPKAIITLKTKRDELNEALMAWERAMMAAIGEDGIKSVSDAIGRLKEDRLRLMVALEGFVIDEGPEVSLADQRFRLGRRIMAAKEAISKARGTA